MLVPTRWTVDEGFVHQLETQYNTLMSTMTLLTVITADISI